MNPFATPVALCFVAALLANRPAGAAAAPPDEGENETTRYIQGLVGTYETPGSHGGAFACDAPFAGNGAVRVALLGDKAIQRFHVSEAGMWTDSSARQVTLGGITFAAKPGQPETKPAAFRQRQHLWDAGIEAHSAAHFTSRTIVCATENTMVVELSTESETPVAMTASLWAEGSNPHMPATAGIKDGMMWAGRETLKNGARWVTSGAMAARILGAEAVLTTDKGASATGSFTLRRGQSVSVVVTVEGARNAPVPTEKALARGQAIGAKEVAALKDAHARWWHAYWGGPWLRTYDETWDQAYFGSLYLMASVNREGSDPAGQYPLCMGDNPGWDGDYHLNQEYMGQYCWGFSGNRPHVIGNAFQPLLDFVPEGKAMAQKRMGEIAGNLGPRQGILYPVGILPHGFCPFYRKYQWKKGVFWNQVSNASYTGMLFIWNYEYYQDREWLRQTGYPFLRLLGDFWESHLVKEGDRFVSYGGAWEGGYGKNPGYDLALSRRVLTALIAFSKDLGVDADKRPQWQHIVDNLSAFPTRPWKDKQIFRGLEGSNADHPVCILEGPIFPAEIVGPDSPKELLQTARDTFERYNGGAQPLKKGIFGARIGWPADDLFSKVKSGSLTCKVNAWTGFRRNLTIGDFHGMGELLEFLQISMLQSDNGVIRFFPLRRTGKPAAFHDLRARGAFIVSAELKDGEVGGVRIASEKGKPCTVLNPWPGKSVRVIRDGKPAETVSGERFTFGTKPGEMLELHPQ